MRRFVVIVLVLVAVSGWAVGGATVMAQPAAAVPDKRELKARADFAAGRYQKAVDAFATLFAETGDPVFLRNIARCYQKMKRPREAIDSFRDYLRKGQDLTDKERREIDGYIKEMEELEAQSRPAAATTPPAAAAHPEPSAPPRATAPAPSAPPPARTTAAPAAASSAPTAGGALPGGPAPTIARDAGASPDGRRTLRVAGIATAAAGVALVAAGAAFGLAARSAADQVSQQYNADTDSAGKRDVKLQWVGYGLGAAALATGAVLYLRGAGGGSGDGATAAAWRPGVAFDGVAATVTLSGGFR